ACRASSRWRSRCSGTSRKNNRRPKPRAGGGRPRPALCFGPAASRRRVDDWHLSPGRARLDFSRGPRQEGADAEGGEGAAERKRRVAGRRLVAVAIAVAALLGFGAGRSGAAAADRLQLASYAAGDRTLEDGTIIALEASLLDDSEACASPQSASEQSEILEM